jgi:hypothetical protein
MTTLDLQLWSYHDCPLRSSAIDVGWKPSGPRGATDADSDGATRALRKLLSGNNVIWYERIHRTDGFEALIG